MRRRKFLKQVSAARLLPVAGNLGGPTVVTAGASASSTALNIASDRQLFIDEYLIAAKSDVTLTINPPRKTGEANIVSEHPWEDFYAGGWNTVMEDEGLYKMWYEGFCSFDPDSRRDKNGRFLCYATSTDGVRWEKPMVNLVEFRGAKKNNILIRDTTGTVFLDPQKTDGNRFKYMGWWFGDGKGPRGKRVWVFTSPDGVRWKTFGDEPIMGGPHHFDTQNQILWDDRLRKYVAYVRHNEEKFDARGVRHQLRQTYRAETANLAKWPATSLVFAPDDVDPVVSDHYNIGVNKYPYAPNVYLGFPSAYFHTEKDGKNDGPLDIQLISSRDGIAWNRTERRPYIRLGIEGSDEDGSLYMTVGMIRKGDELWMYYTGYDFTHGSYDLNTMRKKGVVSRVVQRLDGFMSADAAYTGGELRTKPLTFTGNKLVLNVDTGAMGSVRVEVLDKDSRPLPGFTAKDAVVNGNFINHTVTWAGKSDVGSLSAQPVQLRFVMRNTKLYAFQFVS